MSSLYDRSTTHQYGLTAVPAHFSPSAPSPPLPTFSSSEFAVPSTALARRIDAYAAAHLPSQTYRHSRRVYAWGLVVARSLDVGLGSDVQVKLEKNSKLEETWFCTAMLHDIGTPPEVLTATRLSYEFWAGVECLKLLQQGNTEEGIADKEQAESIAEAIFRHQDVQDKGQVTVLTRLIHVGTLLDNVGKGREWVGEETVRAVLGEWPRVVGGDEKGWSDCFRGTVEMEKTEKPYAMVSRIEGFEEMISANVGVGGGFEGREEVL